MKIVIKRMKNVIKAEKCDFGTKNAIVVRTKITKGKDNVIRL